LSSLIFLYVLYSVATVETPKYGKVEEEKQLRTVSTAIVLRIISLAF